MLRTSRTRLYQHLPICQGLTPEEQRNYFHKSTFDSYTFQNAIPRMPIPTLNDTIDKYIASLKAQKGSLITEATVQKQLALIEKDRPHLELLQQKLLDYDKENEHTSYLSTAWFEMYLKDRSRLPFYVTPYLGFKTADDPKLNEVTLRASNIIISCLRLNNTLDKNWLEPELFPISKKGPSEKTWKRGRKLINFLSPTGRFIPPVGGFTVPIGKRAIAAYAALQMAPLDMSQYKNLFKSTRIPGKDIDSIKKFEKSDHVLIMSRGRFYKLTCYDSQGNILDYKSIQRAVQDIFGHAKANPYNEDSLAYLSSMNRDDWAEIRPHVINSSSKNAENLNAIDSAIFNIVLEDQLKHQLEFDIKSTHDANSCFLWGNGANRWWDKSISWIVTEGGDAGLTFEHAWGDGVAVMRCAKDVWNESTGEYGPPMLTESGSLAEAAPWEELKFDIDGKIAETIATAKSQYNAIAEDFNTGGKLMPGVGKNFFKAKKLSGDAIVQLAIQAAYKRANNLETCPVYQSVSTSAFLHGRTENLRPCSEKSSKAATMLAKFDGTQDLQELAHAIRDSASYHNTLKEAAQSAKGFDRHIYGLNHHAKLNNLKIPKCFNDQENETWARMNHFIISTSTLDVPFCQSGGFGAVVPDGLGCGYASMPDLMACNVTSRKSTQSVDPNDFAAAFGKTFEIIEQVFEAEKSQKS